MLVLSVKDERQALLSQQKTLRIDSQDFLPIQREEIEHSYRSSKETFNRKGVTPQVETYLA